MNATSVLTSVETGAKATKQSTLNRLLCLSAAMVFLALTLIGFQEFYLHGRAVGGRQISPRILSLVVCHGVVMTSWIILFQVQTILVASGHRRQHVLLGWAGAILAAGIGVSGIAVAIESTRVHPELYRWGLTQKQFMVFPLSVVLKFLVFVSVGVWARRRPEVHRPMMLLATLSVVQPATARVSILNDFYEGGMWAYLLGPALPILILGALFLVAQWVLTRRFDRWYASGYAALLITSPLIMELARSQAWDRFATFLLQS